MTDETEPSKSRLPIWLLILAVVVLGLGALLGWRQFGPYPTYTIPSGSMIPTLQVGDMLVAHGARGLCNPPELKAGQIILMRDRGTTFVRRLIAGPGQTVQMIGGRLWIEGAPVKTEPAGSTAEGRLLRETLSNGATYLTQDLGDGSALDDTPPIKTPAGHWFTLGDNRDNAMDSRATGPTAASQICAQAVRIVYSKDPDAIGRRLD